MTRGSIAAIGQEPSGGYERDVVRILLAAGSSVRRINRNKLRQFARAAGALAKNDRIDARLIADYITVMPTRVVERNPAIERLAETVTMRRQLCDEQIAVASQASHLEDALLQRIAKRRLTRIKADIVLLDKCLAELVAAQPDLVQRFPVMQGPPLNNSLSGYAVRRARTEEAGACNALCPRVHGFERSGEVAETIARNSATVVERLDRITGYATEIGFFAQAVASA